MTKYKKNVVKKVKEFDKQIPIKKRLEDYLQYCKMFGVNPNQASNLLAFYQEKVDMSYIGMPID